MRRAYRSLIITGLIVVLAAGCAAHPAAPVSTAAAPTNSVSQAPGTVTAKAAVEPARWSDMAFLIGAPVKEVKVREGEQVKAGQPLIVLDTPDLMYAVEAAQAEVKSAQANADLQRAPRKKWNGRDFVYVSSPPEWKQKADARVAQAQAALELAQAELAQATLAAPFDGTVVSIDVATGEMVAPQEPVLVIADLSNLQVATTDLSEREIADIRPGETASTQLKAFEQDLSGRVVSIAPKAELSNGDTVFKVTIALDQPPEGLMWGMTGDVYIEVDK